MKRAWPTVRLEEVLTRREPDVTVQPNDTHQFAGVYSLGRGVFRGTQRHRSAFVYKGLGHRRQRVQPAQILRHIAWIPPMASQERLAVVHAEVGGLECLQAETINKLDALLPAIVDRAFRGAV